jgi:hypothetical protein
MTQPRLVVTGEEQVMRALDELATRASDPDAVNERLAELGLRVATEHVPVLTGVLEASIDATVGKGAATLATDVGYAPYPEFGTPTAEAQPFMGPAFEAMSTAAEPAYTDWLGGILADVQR